MVGEVRGMPEELDVGGVDAADAEASQPVVAGVRPLEAGGFERETRPGHSPEDGGPGVEAPGADFREDVEGSEADRAVGEWRGLGRIGGRAVAEEAGVEAEQALGGQRV